MRIPVSSKKSGRLNLPLRAYLLLCAAILYNVRRLKILACYIFNKFNLNFVTLLLLSVGLVYVISNTYKAGKSALAMTNAYEYIETYEYNKSAIPLEFFEQIDLTCNKEEAFINLSNPQTISTKIALKNNSIFSVVLQPGGIYTLHLRARIWDVSLKKMLKDGVRVKLKIDEQIFSGPGTSFLVLVGANSSFVGEAEIDIELFQEIPKGSKYLVLGVVQEGVRWASTKGCKFGLSL